MEEIDLKYVKVSYKAPIFYLTFKEGTELGVPEIQELTANCERLSGGVPYFVFSDVRVSMNVTHEGRRLAGNAKKAPLHRGTAVLVKNLFFQIAAELFSQFDKPEFPYRVFTDETEALNWLLQLAGEGVKTKDTDIGINLNNTTEEQPGTGAGTSAH